MKNIGLRLIALVFAAVAAAAHAGPFAFITEASGGVSMIDVETRQVVTRIPLSAAASGVATANGSRRAYVAMSSASQVAVIDTAARALVALVTVEPSPVAVALNPSETRVFVVHSTGHVSTINTENLAASALIPTGAGASRVALNPSGTLAFISNTQANTVTVFDALNLVVLRNISVPDGPMGLAVDPSGQRLYVAQQGNATAGDTVSVVDIASGALVASVRVGSRPDSLVVNTTGGRLYVTNRNSDTVSVVDTGSFSTVATIPVGSGPVGIDITARGDFLYVANNFSSSVTVLTTEPPSAFHTLAVGAQPLAIGRFIGGPAPSSPTLPDVLSGLFWNAAESGWGIHLTQRRNTIFAAWFTYDGAGQPKWYIASSCAMNAPLPCATCVEGAFCSGELFEASGPTFFRDRFNPAALVVRSVGVLQLEFSNKDAAKMTYGVGSRTRQVQITRQPVAAGGVAPVVNYTDLWWNPSESGWGLGITHQFGMMFLAWFVYDDFGKPIWYVASNCEVVSTANGCRGTLYRTSGPIGPVASDTFNSSAVRVTSVGSIDVAFSDANNGVIVYTVDGVSGSKTITRQVF